MSYGPDLLLFDRCAEAQGPGSPIHSDFAHAGVGYMVLVQSAADYQPMLPLLPWRLNSTGAFYRERTSFKLAPLFCNI